MILTKKQLEDAAKCEELMICKMPCAECALSNIEPDKRCVEIVATEALKYREMLERLEFSNLTWDGAECAICGGKNEHEADCELAKLLK
jgi:hypothetical protein